MEMAGAVSREGELEAARRLVKKRKAGKGKLEGDNGFDGDFGSVSEKKAYDLNVAVDAELDLKNGKKKKKKRKKDAIELEELGDGGFIMGDENGGSFCESEDKTKLDKKKRKKEKKKADKDTMELEEPGNIDMGGGDDRENGGSVCESEDKTKLDKKKRKKENKKADKDTMELEEPDNVDMGEGDDRENGGSVCESEDKTKLDKKKRKKEKKKADKDTMELEEPDNVDMDEGDDRESGGSVCESEDKTKLDKKKKKKEKKKSDKDTVELEEPDNVDMGEGDGRVVCESKKYEKCSVTLEEGKQVDMSKREDKKRKGKKNRKESGNIPQDVGQNTLAAGDMKRGNKEREKSKDKNDAGEMRKEKVAQRKDKGKRVSFTDAVEVFGDDVDDKESDKGGVEKSDEGSESKLVHGKRFTREEDAKLMEAIMNYAEMKQLGEKGLEMIRASLNHPELRGCWREIPKALPHRPPVSVYKRARIILYRSAARKWTEEEYEIIRQFVAKHGQNWKTLAIELGKSDIHVKDTWRRIKPKNLRKGPWDQEEYQNLFDLVNLDLRVKAHQKINHGHRNIRDNISWEAISDKLTTRSVKDCCLKWYQQLASPLVKQGVWTDGDDYRLVEALQKVDAVCLEDVDWDNLLDHRSGEVCRQRWNQMVRCLGGHRERSFIEQVEVLSRRYSPEMVEYRK